MSPEPGPGAPEPGCAERRRPMPGPGAGPGRPELGNTFEYSGEYADRGVRRANAEVNGMMK